MNPAGLFGRFACWLARGNNSFNLLLFITVPPLVAITMIGFF